MPIHRSAAEIQIFHNVNLMMALEEKSGDHESLGFILRTNVYKQQSKAATMLSDVTERKTMRETRVETREGGRLAVTVLEKPARWNK